MSAQYQILKEFQIPPPTAVTLCKLPEILDAISGEKQGGEMPKLT